MQIIMERAYKLIFNVWAVACIINRLWTNSATNIIASVLGVMFYLSFILLIYTSWRETKSIRKALKKNAPDAYILLIPSVAFVILGVSWFFEQ